jgi:hypothetical protein
VSLQPTDHADAARFAIAHGAHATAIDVCSAGLARDPDNALLYVYRAAAYDEFGRSAEAAADCAAAIRLAPDGRAAILAGITLALVRERMGDRAGALAAARAAIALDPAERESHAALGTLLAWHGDFPAAWPELECHWIAERVACRQRFPDLAEWNGEDIAGRRLLLVHGQGLGDLLLMLRYLPRVRERCAELVLEVPPALLRLAQTVRGADAVAPRGSVARDRIDAVARLMALPRVLAEDGVAGRSSVPYLHAGERLVATWARRLAPRTGRVRVGLAWAGNPAHPNDRRRSLSLAALAPLAETPGVAWVSLQVGTRADDDAPAAFDLTRFGTTIGDLADTAAIVAQLDLVVSVDTSVAHLAGALGKPVWLLLPWRADWRWPGAGTATPWYPATRIFHATGPTWDGAIADVAAALSEWVAAGSPSVPSALPASL